MSQGFMFGRNDGSVDVIVPVGTVLATAALLTGGVNTVTAAAGAVAVVLPLNTAQGNSIAVYNSAATAVTLTVFPPTALGRIFPGVAGAAFSVAQSKTALFIPLANGLDFVAVLSA
jgi:hypothetical protein